MNGTSSHSAQSCVVCRHPVVTTGTATFDNRFGIIFGPIPKGPCRRDTTAIHPHCGRAAQAPLPSSGGEKGKEPDWRLAEVSELMKGTSRVNPCTNLEQTIKRMRDVRGLVAKAGGALRQFGGNVYDVERDVLRRRARAGRLRSSIHALV